MAPTLQGIDHIHVYVTSWADAEAWYERVLGFRRVDKFMVWAVEGGPLTLANEADTVHLALFERPDETGDSAIAFGVDGESFLRWKTHLEAQGLELRVSDHDLAYSQYFRDPDDNLHEITTYDHDYVRDRIG
jgi:catechol 2,3-dioxygenase-like lactoylglutathione lyase family enzyme